MIILYSKIGSNNFQCKYNNYFEDIFTPHAVYMLNNQILSLRTLFRGVQDKTFMSKLSVF